MELTQAIRERKSIRCFQRQEISARDLEAVLNLGILAPSGKNGQPWKFLIVQRDKALLERIAELTIYQKFVRRADCLILVFLDKAQSYHYVKDVQAIGACIQNMLLALTDLGLGGCWIGEILNRDLNVKALLGIGRELDLMGMIAAGFPADGAQSPPKKTLRECLLDWR